jgi:hypothetical protein
MESRMTVVILLTNAFIVAIVPSASTPAAIQTTAVPAAASSLVLPVDGSNPVAAPAVAVSTMDPANIQGVNQGPTIDLSNVSLNSVINLGALIQRPTAGPVV